jgi:hypothetical protein
MTAEQIEESIIAFSLLGLFLGLTVPVLFSRSNFRSYEEYLKSTRWR